MREAVVNLAPPKTLAHALKLGYVTARLTECGFIAVGIIAFMALNTLRLHAGDTDPAMLLVTGQAQVAIHDWTFRLGCPGPTSDVIRAWLESVLALAAPRNSFHRAEI